MAKKKPQNLTPDELARREETRRMARERIAYREARELEHETPHEKTQRMVRERIAYHEAKAREQEGFDRHAENQRLVRERIAYHEAKAREQEEAAERKRSA